MTEALALKKRTGFVSVIPEGATVCGWCAEFEDAARRTADFAMKNIELERKNGLLHEAVARIARQLRENNCDEVRRLEEDLRYARRNSRWDSVRGRVTDPFLCPLCDWTPKLEARHPLRSLRMHLRKAHKAVSRRRDEA